MDLKKRKVSVGLGTTANCNLNCPHCYSLPLRGRSLTLDQMVKIIDTEDISSINFGTGENILNPDFPKIVEFCHDRGIKMSVTSNGYTIKMLSDEQLQMFSDVDISLDFPTEEQQNDFRKGFSWDFVNTATKRLTDLGVEFSFATAMMNTNYKQIPGLLERAAKDNCNLRLNIFKPVPQMGIYEFQLSYDEFWEGVGLLFKHGNLISCSEPIVNAMLDIKSPVPQSPCGLEALRIHPDGKIVPCVYWPDSDVTIDDLNGSFDPAFESEAFETIRTIPEYCTKECDKVDICGGGCASRRLLSGHLDGPDDYCPIYNNKPIPEIEVSYCEDSKDLVHSSYLCTFIFEGKK